MSCYMCEICGEFKDADIHGCCENPKKPYGNCCEDCYDNLEEEEIKYQKRLYDLEKGIKNGLA